VFKKLLNRIIDKLQATFPPNRIVVLLTPILFMPLAGSVTAWTATHFPGLALSEGIVIGLAGAAALAALTLAYKWLDQWQRGETIDFGADFGEVVDQFVAELQTDPEARRELLEHVPELLFEPEPELPDVAAASPTQ